MRQKSFNIKCISLEKYPFKHLCKIAHNINQMNKKKLHLLKAYKNLLQALKTFSCCSPGNCSKDANYLKQQTTLFNKNPEIYFENVKN